MTLRIELLPELFTPVERLVAAFGEFRFHAFRYPSGVAALRMANARGEIVVLPFQGQQIWRACFDGHDLTMRSMFAEPIATRTYLENYGAFYLHCGLTAIGSPGPEDRHELHGELPNAPFQNAWLEIDEGRGLAALCGSFDYAMAFTTHYRATTRAQLSAGSAMIDVDIHVENRRKSAMALMYLGHANFRPVDYAELDYSARYSPETVRVRQSVPGHIDPPEGYVAMLERLGREPEKHHRLDPAHAYDPEIVIDIDFEPGPGGKAFSRQIHPDGSMDYIEFDPEVFSRTIRWICRTPDQDALGMALPSTTGGSGRKADMAAGRYVDVAGGGEWRANLRLGRLSAQEWNVLQHEPSDVRAEVEAGAVNGAAVAVE